MKIASVVGARPNFVKLAPIHEELVKISEHIIINTGQHYDFNLSKVFFEEFDIPNPNFDLEIGPNTPGQQLGEMIKKLDAVLLEGKYDLVMVYGDTNSTLAGALSANKTETPLAHVESGLRSFDWSMPEEINRVLTDKLSKFLFAPTPSSVINLRKEPNHNKIFNTGDVSVEIINKASRKASATKAFSSQPLNELDLKPKDYLLMTMHRSENTKEKESIIRLIKIFEKLQDYKVIFPIHPRTLNFIKECNLYERIKEIKNLELIDPVGYIDFIKLMKNSNKIITDSGGVQKEAFLLGIPCLTMRKNSEWIETIQMGYNLLTGMNPNKIANAVKTWNPIKPNKIGISKAFGNGKTSKTIKTIINKWFKEIE